MLITVIYKPLIGEPQIIEIENTHEAVKRKLGAKNIDVRYFAPGMVMIVDADWRKKNYRLNCTIHDVAYHGPIILCFASDGILRTVDSAEIHCHVNWPEYYRKGGRRWRR